MKYKISLAVPTFLHFTAQAQQTEVEQEVHWYNSPGVWIVVSALLLLALVLYTKNRNNKQS